VLLNGAPQRKQTESGAVQRWASGAEISLAIDASVEQLGPGAREAVMQAFGAWLGSGARLPKLRFDVRRGATAKLQRDGVSSVLVGPIDIAGHEHDLAITIGFADTISGRITEADIIINSDNPVAVLSPVSAPDERDGPGNRPLSASACEGRYDLQSILTHEVGHFFGLDEDGEDEHATMFYKTGKCDLRKRDLGEPDSSTMSALYATELKLDETQASSGCAIVR
jgi:hypothetical protein